MAMQKPRSQRLQPIERLAKAEERTAARRLRDAQQTLAECEARLQELSGFLDSYAPTQPGEQSLSPMRLHEYRLFLTRLNDAIRQQQRLVEHNQLKHESVRRQWVHMRSRAKAMDHAVQRLTADERLRESRREQKAEDEVARAQKPPFAD